MRVVGFHNDAFNDYTNWAKTDSKLFERIHRLIIETARNPFSGIGKPEPLKGEMRGYWSRRINDEH
jgi:toxin YoeB